MKNEATHDHADRNQMIAVAKLKLAPGDLTQTPKTASVKSINDLPSATALKHVYGFPKYRAIAVRNLLQCSRIQQL